MKNPFDMLETKIDGLSEQQDIIYERLKALDGKLSVPIELRLVTKKEAAEMLSCSLMTIHRLVKKGKLTPRKIDTHVRFKYQDILDLVDASAA